MAEDPVETCHKLSELGCRFVGVTLGVKGYIAMVDGRVIKKPAYTAKAIDTTGCGDAFHAGVSYGIVQGWKCNGRLGKVMGTRDKDDLGSTGAIGCIHR